MVFKYPTHNMSKTFKFTILVVTILILTIIVKITSSKNHVQPTGDKEVIKIGVVAPLTGPGALFGNSLTRGVEMALKDLSETKFEYELIVENDEMDPKKSVTAASKLINIDNVSAIISTTSGTGNAIAPIAQDSKILHIAVSSSPATAEVGNYNFTNLPFPEREAEKWVQEAKSRNLKKIAIISMKHPGIDAIVEAVRQEALSRSLNIVFDEQFISGTTEFNTIILKAEEKNPDVYFMLSFPPSLDIFGQAYRELGISKPLSTDTAFVLSSKKELFEGMWYVDASLKDKSFINRFENHFPNTTFNSRTAPFGYDSLNMLVNAFEDDTNNPVEYMNDLDSYEGTVGRLTKTPEGRFDSPAGIWVIKNGKPMPLE